MTAGRAAEPDSPLCIFHEPIAELAQLLQQRIHAPRLQRRGEFRTPGRELAHVAHIIYVDDLPDRAALVHQIGERERLFRSDERRVGEEGVSTCRYGW